MSQKNGTLSLFAAILININIMLGSGIFINSTVLAKQVGILSGLSYLIVGILMLPLILTIRKLVSLYPSGGFYTFGSKAIHPFVGFVSSWSYVIGKLASGTIIVQIAILLLQQTIPLLAAINALILNAIVMIFFVILNMFDVKTGKTIQAFFFGLKTIPVLFGIFISLYLFSPANVQATSNELLAIPLSLPLVVFAIAGFEAACSISTQIKDAHKNAGRAILISYGIVILTTSLFQFMIYGALGTTLGQLLDYRALFPELIHHACGVMNMAQINIVSIIHIAIAASALGGGYGVIFSNSWNVYTLAQHRHLFGSKYLVKKNRYAIPWLCVIIEGIIYLSFLITSRGNQIPLQQLGALGPTIAYTFSSIALLVASKGTDDISSWTPRLAIGSCFLLIGITLYGFMTKGMSSLIMFCFLLLIGCIMFVMMNKQCSTNLDRKQCQEAQN